MKVLVDTNGLMVPAQHGIDVFEELKRLGYDVSEITDRDYGQTEFFVTDDDGYSHCFGVATTKAG